MKINIELSPLEFKHVTTSGSLEAMIDDLATVSAEVGNAIVKSEEDPKPETQKQQKKDTKKTQKPDPKPEPEKEEETAADEPEETTNAGSDSEVSLEEVRAKLAELMKKGKKAEVSELLAGFDAQKLTDVDESDYAALLEKANKI